MNPNDNETLYIRIKPQSIATNLTAHNYLSKLCFDINNSNAATIIIDMCKVEFIASNQFAILGCILDNFKNDHPDISLKIRGLSNRVKEVIQKNGFYQHLDLEKLPDIHNSVIPYRYFSVDDILTYEKYLFLYLLNRNDLPTMTSDVKNNILDYMLEIFKNVYDHTSSKRIYTCGQYFPKSSRLFFTMVDAGETIPYNVNNYFNKFGLEPPANPLEWALQEGHTTLSDDGPRGIGLSLIKSFFKINKGSFYIVSGKNAYEIANEKERYRTMDYSFPGTIVTFSFNLNDESLYYMDQGTIQDIQF